MNWPAVLNFFGESVPAWAVAILIVLVIIGMFLWHLKVLLSNHVTETDKKIVELRREMKEGHARLEKKIETLVEQAIKRSDDRFDQLSARFDRLYELLLKDRDKK